MSKLFTLPVGTQNSYRQGQGRLIYLRAADGPITVRIGEVDYPLLVGQGVHVPEGFNGYLISNDHTAANTIELVITNNDYIDNRSAGDLGVTGRIFSTPDGADRWAWSPDNIASCAIEAGKWHALFIPPAAGKLIVIDEIVISADVPIQLAQSARSLAQITGDAAAYAATSLIPLDSGLIYDITLAALTPDPAYQLFNDNTVGSTAEAITVGIVVQPGDVSAKAHNQIVRSNAGDLGFLFRFKNISGAAGTCVPFIKGHYQ